jgi:hypothetical protein
MIGYVLYAGLGKTSLKKNNKKLFDERGEIDYV